MKSSRREGNSPGRMSPVSGVAGWRIYRAQRDPYQQTLPRPTPFIAIISKARTRTSASVVLKPKQIILRISFVASDRHAEVQMSA